MRCDRVEVFGCQLGKVNSSENFRAFLKKRIGENGAKGKCREGRRTWMNRTGGLPGGGVQDGNRVRG